MTLRTRIYFQCPFSHSPTPACLRPSTCMPFSWRICRRSPYTNTFQRVVAVDVLPVLPIFAVRVPYRCRRAHGIGGSAACCAAAFYLPSAISSRALWPPHILPVRLCTFGPAVTMTLSLPADCLLPPHLPATLPFAGSAVYDSPTTPCAFYAPARFVYRTLLVPFALPMPTRCLRRARVMPPCVVPSMTRTNAAHCIVVLFAFHQQIHLVLLRTTARRASRCA